MILTIFLFVLLIGVLVIVHEFGHFFVAKKLGIRVDEFAFGFPPRIFSFVKGGTRYALNLLPIGGYVKIFGESGEGAGQPESFISRPIWQRFFVIAAGVIMNIVLAWVFFSVGAAIGMPAIVTPENENFIEDISVVVTRVAEGSPAEAADLRLGDSIVSAASKEKKVVIKELEDLQQFVAGHLGVEIALEIQRGKEVVEKKVVPRKEIPLGQGPLGLVLDKIGIIRIPWYKAWFDGAKILINSLVAVVFGLISIITDLFKSGQVSADVTGPIGIFVFARNFIQLGISYFLQLAASLSVSLAIFNALPFPALDGGRMLFLAIEKIKGSKVDEGIERAIHTVGFILLLLLILAVSYRDIVHYF